MILAIDTSTAACSTALFDGSGACIERRDETIGRGHAERLVPLLDELLAGRRAGTILVGIGPGSFTGIRVGVAAAYGLSLGWKAELHGMSSLALIAAGARVAGPVVAVMAGGHDELFLQQFSARLEPMTDMLNLAPEAAAAAASAELAVGPAAAELVEARGWGRAQEAWPSAADALALPQALRTLPPKPLYARAPDARARAAA